MAEPIQVWAIEDVWFEIVDDMTDDPVVTIRCMTPVGELAFTAEPVVSGRSLVLRGTHVQGARPGAVGAANLRMIASAVMERLGFDGLIVEGAVRTTGARPGHRPRTVRFTRQPPASPIPGSTRA